MSNLPHQTVEKLQKNHGVLQGPPLDKQRWRARLGILRVKGSPLRSSEFRIEIRSPVYWQYRNTLGTPCSIWNKIFTRTFAVDLINYGHVAQNINQHLKQTEYLQLCNARSFWKYSVTYYTMSWKFLYKIFHNTHTSLYEVIKARLKRSALNLSSLIPYIEHLYSMAVLCTTFINTTHMARTTYSITKFTVQ